MSETGLGTKRGRCGFMYSIFAIFMLSIVIMVVSNPITINPGDSQTAVAQVDETFYFLSSVEQDLTRAGRITAKRTFSAAVNHVSTQEAPLEDGTAENEVISGFTNGTINNTEQILLTDTSFEDWRDRMITLANDGGWKLNITLTGIDTYSQDPVDVYIDVSYNLTLYDSRSETRFDRALVRNYSTTVANISDPLFFLETDGRYTREFATCDYTEHAAQIGTGSDYYYDDPDNWTSGRAVVRPGNGGINGVSDRNEKVLIVEDACAYADAVIQDDFDEFKGVISETARSISSDGSTLCGTDSTGINAYISGISGITSDVSNDTMTVMTDNGGWTNNILDEIDNACYFEDVDGPHIFDRLEGELTASGSYTGWSSFVDVPSLPSEFQDTSRSAIDHVYFDDAASTTNHQIKGVTDHYSWFKLDQDHVDTWGLNDLVY